jgi:hypothetical protein
MLLVIMFFTITSHKVGPWPNSSNSEKGPIFCYALLHLNGHTTQLVKMLFHLQMMCIRCILFLNMNQNINILSNTHLNIVMHIIMLSNM